MPYQTLTYQKADRVGTITLNHPETNNAINRQMAGELADVCAKINQDQEVNVVTVTGAGEGFSVGTDWSSPSAKTEFWPVAESMSQLDCPVIAAINGNALGQGLELALACDLRIAAESALLGLPQIKSDLIPWDGGTQRLSRLVGKAKALEMILLGESISAQEAYRLGLVNQVVPPGELSLVVADLTRKIAASAPIASKYAKEAVHQGLDMTLEQGLRLETDLYLLLQTTEDRTEGITSFLKKRRPKFKGK